MAAIPVVLNGTFTSDAGSTVGTFIGTMAYADRGPGGGPIVPPDDKPPGIWPGPGDPDFPGGGPHPAHPIVLPGDPGWEPPTKPPEQPPTRPSNPNWEWGWNLRLGWHPVYVPGDKPQPVPPPGGGTPPDPNAPQVNPLPA